MGACMIKIHILYEYSQCICTLNCTKCVFLTQVKPACLAVRPVAFVGFEHSLGNVRVALSTLLVFFVVEETTGGFRSVKVLQPLEILGLVVGSSVTVAICWITLVGIPLHKAILLKSVPCCSAGGSI